MGTVFLKRTLWVEWSLTLSSPAIFSLEKVNPELLVPLIERSPRHTILIIENAVLVSCICKGDGSIFCEHKRKCGSQSDL